MRFSLLQERSALFNYPRSAPIAQLVEQLICNQWVGSSSLSGGTIKSPKTIPQTGFQAAKCSRRHTARRLRKQWLHPRIAKARRAVA